MKSIYVIIATLLLTHICEAKDFYVSTNGSDNNPGTKEQAFATLAYARDQVQLWNQSNASEDITVWLSGGEYRLTETLVFGLEHSAKHGQIITYAALPGEFPVINSDVTISGWKKLGKSPEGLPHSARGKVWVAPVPKAARGLLTVYNSKGMLPRARTEVFKHLRESSDQRGSEDVYKTIPFEKGTTDKLFTPGNAEIVVVPDRPWTMCILPVESVDHETGMVTLGASSTYGLAAPRWYMEPEVIWVENSFAGLDEPGEWVYDDEKDLLYYWPQDTEKPGDDIVVPQLIEMIRVEGSIDYDGPADTPVQGLNFKGITFCHGDRYESFGRTGRGIQHDWERFDESTALIRFRGAENCGVEDCILIHSGGTGIRLDLHAQNIRIVNNELSELGGGGVLLAGYGPGTKDVNINNEVSNNYIHHIGKLWWHAFGIWAWQSGHNLISHNTIHDVPYSAILVTGRTGWDRSGRSECSLTVRWHETGAFTGKETWEERERFLHGRNNIIENNDLHHVMTVMHDGNGVYISGAGTGNIVRGNFVHDTPSMAAGEAIRCDDDQHETLIENNVVYRFGTHGIGICTKGRNHIFNNIVACPPHRVNRGMLNLEPTSKMGISGSRILKNIFYANQANQPFMFRRQGDEFRNGMEYVLGTFVVDKNIYFNSSDPNAADDYLEWAREYGHEKESIKEDPLFMDIENGDFRLKPDSPALKLGFRPFELDAGRKTKK